MNIRSKIREKIDNKTKPLKSLGKLEEIALQIGTVLNTETPELKDPTIIIFVADHGIAQEGVSAYPQEVTFQMLENFSNGGSAINVFSKQHNIRLHIVDAGIKLEDNRSIYNNSIYKANHQLIQKRVGNGTKNFLTEPAMSIKDCLKAIFYGQNIINEYISDDCNIIGFGEMGIGNTSSASLIMSNICDVSIDECVGKGTGLDFKGVDRKINILNKCNSNYPKYYEILRNSSLKNQTELKILSPTFYKKEALYLCACFGGFEIAMMCGAMIEATNKNMVFIVDGFIATSAFLIAHSLQPNIINNALFSHLSNENGHAKMLDFLEVSPIMHLELCLGEGTGCALAYPLIKSSVEFLNKMATFESANISRQKSEL